MKNFKTYWLAVVCCSLLASCIVDDEIDADTETFSSPLIVGFTQSSLPANFIQEEDQLFDFEVPVHLLGGASGQPSGSSITVSYEQGTLADLALSDEDLAKYNAINDNGTPNDLSDDYRNFPLAEEGVHFNFDDTVRDAVIPNNGTFDMIPLKVINNEIDAGKTTLLVLNLKTITAVDNVVVSEQLKSVLIQVQLCRTDLVGDYFITFASGDTQSTVTELSPGLYRATYLPTFSSTYSFDFTACAGELTIVGWEFNENNSSTASYYITQGVPGVVNENGDLVFNQVSMTDVGFYVNLDWTLIKN